MSKAPKVNKQREVVLEIEHVKLVRKRTRTDVRFCRGCSRSTDFLVLTNASELFEVTTDELFEFATANHCHFLVDEGSTILICLSDLLRAMDRLMNKRTIRLLRSDSE